MAQSVISLPRGNSVAFGAKPTLKRTPRYRDALFEPELLAHQVAPLGKRQHSRLLDRNTFIEITYVQHAARGNDHAPDIDQRRYPFWITKCECLIGDCDKRVECSWALVGDGKTGQYAQLATVKGPVINAQGRIS